MSADVFETSKVVLTCTVVRGKSSSNKAKFSVLRDGKEFSSKEVPLDGDEAKYEIEKLPEVKADEESWVLTYKVTSDGKDYDGAEIHNVWPLKLKLKAVKEADSKAFPMVPFLVTQSGAAVTARTGTDGSSTHWLRLSGAFSVDVGPQFRLVKWNKQTGREWEAVVDDRVDPDFEAPAEATDKKQWVNLPTATNGQDHNGSLVKLTVFAKGDGGGKGGKTGNKIFIEVEYGTKDPKVGGAWKHTRNLPKRELKGVEGLRQVDGGKKQTGFVKLAADGGTASFEVELGLAGGDTCKVKIGGTPACDGPTREFENWRRLNYEVVAPDFMASLADKTVKGRACKDLPAATVAQIKRRADAAFFEYVLQDSHIFSEAEAPAGTVKTGAWGGKPGQAKLYLLSDHTFTKYPKVVDKSRPRTMFLKLCDKNYYFDPSVAAPTVTTLAFIAAATTIDVGSGAFTIVSGANGAAALRDVRWKAKFADVQTWMKMPVLEWASPNPKTAGAVEGVIVVKETLQNSELTLTFKHKFVGGLSKTTLQKGDQAKIQPWMDALLNTPATLRSKGNKLKIQVTASTKNKRSAARFDFVKAEIQAAFDASPGKKKISTHPGLNDDASPKTKVLALTTDYTVEEVEARKFKVTLLGSSATLVGATETATKCPLDVTLTYEKLSSGLGLSGSGAQIGENLIVYEAASPDCTTDTLLHELGHSMGLVYFAGRGGKALPPGMVNPPVVAAGDAYDETHGGSGTHCAFGVGNKAAAAYNGANKGTCLMLDWGPSSDPSIATSGFCATCRDYVRGVDLSTL